MPVAVDVKVTTEDCTSDGIEVVVSRFRMVGVGPVASEQAVSKQKTRSTNIPDVIFFMVWLTQVPIYLAYFWTGRF